MPSAVDVQTAPGIPTGAAPPPDSINPNGLDTIHEDVTNDLPVGAPAHNLDDDNETKGNLYENAPKKEGAEDEDDGGVLIGPDGPVTVDDPVLEDPNGPIEDDPAAADEAVDMQQATVSGKKKKKGRSTAARGPTALLKRCGTGFEGK